MEQARIEEASLRYTADLPARDDQERDFYRTWAQRDAEAPRPDYVGYADYLRSKTPEQLWDLAVATIAAERETGEIAPGWLAESEQSSSGEAELEAGS
jgi:hypothetical protein